MFDEIATRLLLVSGLDSVHLANMPPKMRISPLATTTECSEVAGEDPWVMGGGFHEHEKWDRIWLQSSMNICMGSKPSSPGRWCPIPCCSLDEGVSTCAWLRGTLNTTIISLMRTAGWHHSWGASQWRFFTSSSCQIHSFVSRIHTSPNNFNRESSVFICWTYWGLKNYTRDSVPFKIGPPHEIMLHVSYMYT